ncbi:MAG TPA: AMP-binding protein, partial [Kofleriaceae bacterium]
GHSYIVYGPLANGTTSVMFESVPTYPDAGRYWDMVQRHKITIFYGAPTALRVLANAGNEFVTKYDRSTLRVLGTVGEPINPATWNWFHDVVGDHHASVVDTWWQTETGGHAINPIAGVTKTKPGSATKPLPGIVPALRDAENKVIEGPGEGRLFLEQPWPGQARTVWNDHERFVKTYFSEVPGVYFTGDGCRRDEDGDYWITGRVDDVVNVSGHRMGTAEFESAITSVSGVTEAAVVGYPHDTKGQGIYAFVVATRSVDRAALDAACRKLIGSHARIDKLQIVPGLPKTRSGKVMRRILRKIAEAGGKDPGDLGDLTTLADPGVVEAIKQGAAKLAAEKP